MICVSHCTARYLSERKFDKKAYVIGSKVLKEEIEAVGVTTVGWGPDVITVSLSEQVKNDLRLLDDEVGTVVVGFDQHFSFPKLFKAINYLRESSVGEHSQADQLKLLKTFLFLEFIATNADQTAEFPYFTFPDTVRG